ncbi:MAG TPA: RHS repeat-associated core domain-containing protein [Candidatus Cybelea sp.]|nr:RHS repeat-associated core domain-containing protein [Candidatus Cybelea sp.]
MTRGYTGHEELQHVGLVNMNGHIYDPVLGRFMTADPTVPHPDDLKDFNRYAYVHNNPLAFTDPTAYGLFGGLFHAIGSFLHSFLHNPIVRAIDRIAAAILRRKLA